MVAVVAMERYEPSSKGERANAEDFNGDDQGDAHQNQAPGKLLIQDAVDDRGHEAGLRRGSFVAADALAPTEYSICLGRCVVEIFAVGDDTGAEGVDQRVGFVLDT